MGSRSRHELRENLRTEVCLSRSPILWNFAITSCSNPISVKGNAQTGTLKWSSYRATAVLTSVPEFITTDWVLRPVREGPCTSPEALLEISPRGIESRPWEALQGQIYLAVKRSSNGTRRKSRTEGDPARANQSRPAEAGENPKGKRRSRTRSGIQGGWLSAPRAGGASGGALCDSEPAPQTDGEPRPNV